MTLLDYLTTRAKRENRKMGSVVTSLAEEAGLSPQSLRAYLRGMRIGTVSTSEKLSRATEGTCSPAELLGLDVKKVRK